MHKTTVIHSDMNTQHKESRPTLCFFPEVGSPPKAPRLTNLDIRPCSSSHTNGSLSQNLGGWPPPPAK